MKRVKKQFCSAAGGACIQNCIRNRSGTVLVLVALSVFVLIAIAAFAVDLGYHYVVQNELKNAADAGALAGAENLYAGGTGAVNTISLDIANEVATENDATASTGELPVEINNADDIQTGHWSFANRTFVPVDPADAITLSELWTGGGPVSIATLDSTANYVNAIKVTASRGPEHPLASFFARIFGYTSFSGNQTSVAWIGPPRSIPPGVVNEPIAICSQSITTDGGYTCNVGRMLNSGGGVTNNTGAWTDFVQPCSGGVAATIKNENLICGSGNPEPINYDQLMSTENGVNDGPLFNSFGGCWNGVAYEGGGAYKLWPITLPVINCNSNAVTCSAGNTVVEGLVQVNVLWVNGNFGYAGGSCSSLPWGSVPSQIYDSTGQNLLWSSTSTDGQVRWNSIISTFQLQDANGDPLSTLTCNGYWPKTIYFTSSCNFIPAASEPGGDFFGTLAKYPKLVQ